MGQLAAIELIVGHNESAQAACRAEPQPTPPSRIDTLAVPFVVLGLGSFPSFGHVMSPSDLGALFAKSLLDRWIG